MPFYMHIHFKILRHPNALRWKTIIKHNLLFGSCLGDLGKTNLCARYIPHSLTGGARGSLTGSFSVELAKIFKHKITSRFKKIKSSLEKNRSASPTIAKQRSKVQSGLAQSRQRWRKSAFKNLEWKIGRVFDVLSWRTNSGKCSALQGCSESSTHRRLRSDLSSKKYLYYLCKSAVSDCSR